MILTAIMLVAIVPMVGLAIDASVLYAVKAKLSTACDAAALSAARSLARGLTLADQQASAIARAQAFFNANLPDGYLMTSGKSVTVAVAQTGFRTRTVTVSGSVTAPVIFMSILGFHAATVNALGQASRRDVNLVMVLDHSSSMNTSNSCTPMKNGATYFVQQFANGRDRLALIDFGNQWYLGYGPGMNFMTDSPTMTAQIANVVCGSNTNTATAYMEAYNQLVTINEPGALNVIVLFTDGLGNGITGNFPVRLYQDTRYGYSSGPSGCTNTGSTCTMPPSTCKWANSSLTGANATYLQTWNKDHTGHTYTSGSSPNPYWLPKTVSNPNGTPDPSGTIFYRVGVIAQWSGSATTGTTIGLITPHGNQVGDTSDDINTNDAGCGWATNTQAIRQDIAAYPNTDVYGNRVDCCYQSPDTYSSGPYAGQVRVDKPQTVTWASMNAMDNAAAQVRANTTLGVVTYVIGLGNPAATTDAPDDVLMARMANDPTSPSFDNTKQPGLYVFAPDNTQLQQAFARVASEILRISQ